MVSNNLKPSGVTRVQPPFQGRRKPVYELIAEDPTKNPYELLGNHLSGIPMEEVQEEDEITTENGMVD